MVSVAMVYCRKRILLLREPFSWIVLAFVAFVASGIGRIPRLVLCRSILFLAWTCRPKLDPIVWEDTVEDVAVSVFAFLVEAFADCILACRWIFVFCSFFSSTGPSDFPPMGNSPLLVVRAFAATLHLVFGRPLRGMEERTGVLPASRQFQGKAADIQPLPIV